jgi:DNA-binding transcriptional ArsR family regulator
MSIVVMKLVYQARLGSAARKAVATKLADHAQDDGSQVFPGLSRIAKETELSKSTVQRAIRDLLDAGILVLVEQGGSGPRDTSKYRFDLAKLAALPRTVELPDAPVTDHQKDGQLDHHATAEDEAKVVTVPRKMVTVTTEGSHHDHRTIIEPSEPSLWSELRSDHGGQSLRPRRTQPYSEAFEQFWKAYPDRSNNSKLEVWQEWRKLTAADREDAARSLPTFAAYCRSHPDYRCLHAKRYLRYRRWEAHLPTTAGQAADRPWWRDPSKLAAITQSGWRALIAENANGTWPVGQLGPPPGNPECVVPSALINELRLADTYTATGIRKGSPKHIP